MPDKAITLYGWFNLTVLRRDCLRTQGFQLKSATAEIRRQISFESLLNQYLALNLMPEGRKWHFRASRFQIFLGYNVPRPPLGVGVLRPLRCYCPLLQNWLKPLRSWWFLAISNCHAKAGPREREGRVCEDQKWETTSPSTTFALSFELAVHLSYG